MLLRSTTAPEIDALASEAKSRAGGAAAIAMSAGKKQPPERTRGATRLGT
jgi:hypothetical protein